jgi:hypothetical protein
MNPKPTDKLNIDELAAMFKLPTWDAIESLNEDYMWQAGHEAVKAMNIDYTACPYNPKAAVETDEIRHKAENEAQDELFGSWYDAVIYAVAKLFEAHHLKLEPVKHKGTPNKYPHEYRVKPIETWEKACEQIVDTVCGVGYFHFDSIPEFLESGPYTMREAVLSHLGWIKNYPEVYGATTAQRYYDSAWR